LSNSSKIEEANMEAYNQFVLFWQTNKSILAEKNYKRRSLMYKSAFNQLRKLHIFKGKIVLDVGAGGGSEMDDYLLEVGATILTLDISREMIKIAQKKIKTLNSWKNSSCIVASALYLPFKDKAFDIAITVQALHHVPSPETVVTEMQRAATDLSFFEPNKESAMHKILHWTKQLRGKKLIGTQYEESMVEYNAVGFHRNKLVKMCNKDMNSYSVGLIPNTENFPAPELLCKFLPKIEAFIQHIPIIKYQLGSLIMISKSTKST
jgi:ubiquinone/menaquinone biosynthesis C-methylase UbiE